MEQVGSRRKRIGVRRGKSRSHRPAGYGPPFGILARPDVFLLVGNHLPPRSDAHRLQSAQLGKRPTGQRRLVRISKYSQSAAGRVGRAARPVEYGPKTKI